jgi:hypothetical protein
MTPRKLALEFERATNYPPTARPAATPMIMQKELSHAVGY